MRATELLLLASLAVWAGVAALGWRHAGELRWAADALPRYLRGGIGAPRERVLSQAGRQQLRSDGPTPEARGLLEAAIEIDPYAEAVLWLARLEERAGRPEAALEGYQRYRQIDPDQVEAWLRASQLLARAGRSAEAAGLLRDGLSHFRSREAAMQPRHVPGVETTYYEKALRVHGQLRAAASRLGRELALLEGRRASEPR